MTKKAEQEKAPKGRKGLFLFVKVVLVLIVLGLVVGFLFRVQKMNVKGNDYTPAKDIVKVINEDPLSSNSLYLMVKYRYLNYKKPGSIESIRIELEKPWSVLVEVKEKELVGYFQDGDDYIYFDHDGFVVLKSSELREGLMTVEGVDIREGKQYQMLELYEEELLDSVIDVLIQVKSFELNPDKILCENGEMNLIFGSITVKLGKSITADKIAQITPILSKLTGKTGILHLEHYGDGSTVITFNEEKPDPNEDEEGTGEYSEEDYSDINYDSSDGYEEYYGDDYYYDEEYYDDDYYGEEY